MKIVVPAGPPLVPTPPIVPAKTNSLARDTGKRRDTLLNPLIDHPTPGRRPMHVSACREHAHVDSVGRIVDEAESSGLSLNLLGPGADDEEKTEKDSGRELAHSVPLC
jgi:hypothetical protein